MKSSSQTQSPKTPSPRGGMGSAEHGRSASEPWLVAAAAASASDDSCVNDVDNFARTVAAVKSKAASCARPDMLASVLSHYAAKWLSDVAPPLASSSVSGRFLPPESPTTTWLKKGLLLESLVAALPPDPPVAVADGGCCATAAAVATDDGITCDFLLKLLRAGSMVGADAALLRDLEARAARRLDQATLGAVMIPAFGHAGDHASSALLLDVPLVLRLVRGFLKEGAAAGASKASSGATIIGGGGREGGQARGRVPGRGRAGGRPPPRRVRGARARRARTRASRRRRALPRRRHLPQGHGHEQHSRVFVSVTEGDAAHVSDPEGKEGIF
ncbi:unnamed protein product [Miscanthus lutarioriparius]|uniref:NPH3 domain-containing protein n=1 Tax=Miscanthus lutarioriparius TaxID=422564 RepID=A0A811RR19_9POAL|nr:unnamed protein product [Miscanthus lutarioriparius]